MSHRQSKNGTRPLSLFFSLSVFVIAALGGCGDDAYDPCEDKACGDECTECAPDDPDCVETLVIKVCDADGICGGDATTCP
jgi:hypothetical protein